MWMMHQTVDVAARMRALLLVAMVVADGVLSQSVGETIWCVKSQLVLVVGCSQHLSHPPIRSTNSANLGYNQRRRIHHG